MNQQNFHVINQQECRQSHNAFTYTLQAPCNAPQALTPPPFALLLSNLARPAAAGASPLLLAGEPFLQPLPSPWLHLAWLWLWLPWTPGRPFPAPTHCLLAQPPAQSQIKDDTHFFNNVYFYGRKIFTPGGALRRPSQFSDSNHSYQPKNGPSLLEPLYPLCQVIFSTANYYIQCCIVS